MYTGKLVTLRPYDVKDTAQAQAYVNDPEVKRFLTPGVPFPITFEEEKAWVIGQSAMKDTYSFAIENLENGRYIGGCGINSVDWKNSVAVVGIFIGDKDLWGKGYGTDAMSVLIAFIFEQMNIHKIKLNVYSFNERAIKSYKKVGFTVEGILREEIFKEGKYHDEIVMGLLCDEYFEQKILG